MDGWEPGEPLTSTGTKGFLGGRGQAQLIIARAKGQRSRLCGFAGTTGGPISRRSQTSEGSAEVGQR